MRISESLRTILTGIALLVSVDCSTAAVRGNDNFTHRHVLPSTESVDLHSVSRLNSWQVTVPPGTARRQFFRLLFELP